MAGVIAVIGPPTIVEPLRLISLVSCCDDPFAVDGWNARAWLNLPGQTRGHQAGATAPFKWLRCYRRGDSFHELPLLHTAGGLVGGDQLQLEIDASDDSRALLTTVAAQKVYGSVGRFRQGETRRWACQSVHIRLRDQAVLEWLPQELVLFSDGLLQQQLTVELDPGCSWLGTDVVRLGRSAAGEGLGHGCWRSSLTIRRREPGADKAQPGRLDRWELVDRLQLDRPALLRRHGMAGRPVLGTLVWAAPCGTETAALDALVAEGRRLRQGLEGEMALGRLEQGLIGRYRGESSQAARFWFCRLWSLVRRHQGLQRPELPRVWPFQEDPWCMSATRLAGSST